MHKDDLAQALDAARRREAAMRDVLRIISRSRNDEQPVFETIMENAARLCRAPHAGLLLRSQDDTHLNLVASNAASSRFIDQLRDNPHSLLHETSLSAQVIRTMETLHHHDVTEEYASAASAQLKYSVETEGMRTVVLVPLVSGGRAIGVLFLYKRVVEPFTNDEIVLVETFAAQAVIAIENVRQFRELQSRLEREEATREILEVISQSRDDEQPVFEAIIENARRLCEAKMAAFVMGEEGGGPQVMVAHRGATDATLRIYREGRFPMDPEISTAARAIITRKTIHLHDMADTDAYRQGHPNFVSLVDQQGIRTNLLVPLVAQGRGIGCLILFRDEVRPYSDDQVALIETFAAQAVIAIENVRQFRELQTRLEREEASRQILGVISRSRDDETPVFDTILDCATRLIGSPLAGLHILDETDNTVRLVAHSGLKPETLAAHDFSSPVEAPVIVARAVKECAVMHRPDLTADSLYTERNPLRTAMVDVEGARSALVVPLISGGAGIGCIWVFRREIRAYEDDEIALLQSFAAQAVIAIENVRQFRELQTRLEREEATSEILGVISQSRDDDRLVFDKILRLASRLCDAPIAGLILGSVEDSHSTLAAHTGFSPEIVAMFRDDPPTIDPDRNFTSRAIVSGKVVHTPDMSETETYKSGSRDVRKGVDEGGIRSCLWVPLLSGSRAIGVIALYRQVVRPFTDEQIVLVETFAAQAVIAIENVKQLKALIEARDAAETALTDLKKAQEQLIQSEKMASLGQLTAGIAHEIKNPLNFVNNFAKLSDELLGELAEILEDPIRSLDDEDRDDAEDLMQTVRENLSKINQHGRRADQIIKNMLLHSREGPSERQTASVNAIAEEALNLAYHGARAENPSFSIEMKTDFAEDVGRIDCYAHDLMRVFLNLISNGMYAAHRRSLDEAGIAPVISVSSRVNGDRVEIAVRDNGTGIPRDVREKIFEPFFTTKPAGEGTGLGLSLSYDIAVKQHGGDLRVDSEPGHFTVFTVSLPRTLPAETGGDR